MLTRTVITAAFARLLMAGLVWAPPAEAWGRSGYRFGSPPPPVSIVTPFGSPYSPRALGVPPSPWAPPAGYRFYGTPFCSGGIIHPDVVPLPTAALEVLNPVLNPGAQAVPTGIWAWFKPG